MNRLRAAAHWSRGVRRLISRVKSWSLASTRWVSVCRFCGMRPMICSLVSRSVSETLIVRSKGRVPLWTLVRMFTVFRIPRLQPSTVRRNRLRVTSIFLARAISSSRDKSGISAIWLR